MADGYLLENGADKYLLEDGTGVLLLEPPIVEFDAVSSGNGTGTTVTVSHVCSGDNRVLIVDAALGISPDNRTLTATYNGVAMTSLGLRHSNDDTAGYIEKFILINPASGTHDIVVTRSGTGTPTLIVGGISFKNASQTLSDYTGNFFSAAGSSTTPSVAVTSTLSSSIVQDGAVNGSSFQTVGALQTQRWNLNVDNLSAGGNAAGSTEPGNGGTVTMSWLVDTDWWAIQAVEILTITAVPQDLAVGFLDNAETLFAPSLANQSSLNLSVGFLDNAETLFAPSFVKDLPIGFITSTAQLFAPTLENEAGSDQDLNIPFHEQVTGFFVMSLANQSPHALEIPLLGSGTQLFAPSLETQTPLNVSPGFITSTVQLFAPTLTKDKTIDVAFLSSSVQLFNPSLVNQSPLNLAPGFISSTLIIPAASLVLQANLELEVVFLTSSAVLFLPSLVNEGGEVFEPILAGNGSLIDQITNGLITQGFLAGSVTDRERLRLLNKLVLVDPQSLSMMDLYQLANEDNRLYEIGIDELP